MTARPDSVGVAGAALLAVSLAGCTVNVNTEGATASETHTFTVGSNPRVTLDTFDGSIEVHSWDRDEVEVVVEKQAQDEALLQQIVVDQSQEGDGVTLRVRGPASRSGINIGIVYSPSAKLRVALPKSAALDLKSGDGSISVEDVSGTLVLWSGDGSIVGRRLTGDVRARSDDGSIRLRETTGKVDAETRDGSIVVNGTLTHLRAKTGDGSVRIGAERGSTLEDDWVVETEDGSVEVRLPEGVSAVVDASTSDGSIRSNYPGLTVPRRTDEDRERGDDGRQLTATLGQGGRTLRVRTGDGSIRFEP
ncbi:MAG: DUF4097 family beta strand repeat protein [Acidobacteria bacterium]|nr:DUF4097 family beta strand repeat protein [Acidobacteriota bacterium]